MDGIMGSSTFTSLVIIHKQVFRQLLLELSFIFPMLIILQIIIIVILGIFLNLQVHHVQFYKHFIKLKVN